MASKSAILSLLALALLTISMQGAAAHGVQKWKATCRGQFELPNPVFTDTVCVATFTTDNNGQVVGSLLVKNGINVTAAHIHRGRVDDNGPVAFWLFPTPANKPSDQGINGVWRVFFNFNFFAQLQPNSGVKSYNDFLNLLKYKGMYVNLHDVDHPGGVARGQIEKDGS